MTEKMGWNTPAETRMVLLEEKLAKIKTLIENFLRCEFLEKGGSCSNPNANDCPFFRVTTEAIECRILQKVEELRKRLEE